jgi:hypothetical protein
LDEDGRALDRLPNNPLTLGRARHRSTHARSPGEYLATDPVAEMRLPVDSIAEVPLRLRIEERDLGECSGMLIPSERLILGNAAEATNGDVPIRRQRFTIAHELGHWICHAQNVGEEQATFCRSRDLSQDADRDLEREANVFGAELLMPGRGARGVGCAAGCGGGGGEVRGVGLAAHWRLYSFGLAERPT